jgi:hypothetical protein
MKSSKSYVQFPSLQNVLAYSRRGFRPFFFGFKRIDSHRCIVVGGAAEAAA